MLAPNAPAPAPSAPGNAGNTLFVSITATMVKLIVFVVSFGTPRYHVAVRLVSALLVWIWINSGSVPGSWLLWKNGGANGGAFVSTVKSPLPVRLYNSK